MKIHKPIFLILGILLTGLGIIGILLPVLPTTPFILLASGCFAKGSNRFDTWFKGTKIYKNYAEDFLNDRSMTLGRKIKILLTADLMLLFPLIKLEGIYMKMFILSVIVFKYYYFIFRIKTKKENQEIV